MMIIAQISDTHIGLDDTPRTNLQHAVAHLMALPTRPDAVIISGDCTNNGWPAEYVAFCELLQPLTMPYYVVPGNHDSRAEMLEVFGEQGANNLPGFLQYTVDLGAMRLVMLDTHMPDHATGLLNPAQLAWLDARLAEAPDQPTIVCMHHPPFLTGLAAPDSIRLLDVAAFGAVIARHSQIERIVAGHLHMALVQRFAGTIAQTCGSTAQTMVPDFSRPERLSVLMEPPSCLLHVWTDGVGLATYTDLIGDHGALVELHDGERWLP